MRERAESDISLAGLPRNKVLATVVRLLETTYIRIGNAEYARTNKSIEPLTTMRNRHVELSGSSLRFQLRVKRAHHTINVQDRRLATIVKRCQELPVTNYFNIWTMTESAKRAIDSADVNDYLREISGQDFTAKDFRTWAGTVLAAKTLLEAEDFETEAQARQKVAQAIKYVSCPAGARTLLPSAANAMCIRRCWKLIRSKPRAKL
ncbi:MAG: hypothetical protein WKF84_18145 [Pyrinomonadaceae bacterium]